MVKYSIYEVFFKRENYRNRHYVLNHLFTKSEIENVLKEIDKKGKFEDDRYSITIV